MATAMSSVEVPDRPRADLDGTGQLIANLQAGAHVEESFRQLLQEYGAAIEGYFRQRRFSSQEAEDLTQDTFLNAYLGIHTFRSDSSLKSWLLGVAQNVLRNELRRRSAVKRAAQEIPLEDTESEQTEVSLQVEADELLNDLLREERRQLIVRALRKLPPQMRRCMFLRVLQDLKYHEIAAALRISIQTVRSQLFQARQRLKESLEEVELYD